MKKNEEAENRRREALAEIDAEKIQLNHQLVMMAQTSAPGDDVSHGVREQGSDVTFSKKSIDNEVDSNAPADMIGSGGSGAGMNKDLL